LGAREANVAAGDKERSASMGMKALRMFRSDLIEATDALAEFRYVLEQAGYRLTLLRILEMLVWIENAPYAKEYRI